MGKEGSPVARELGPTFAARAADHDANDAFVSRNYADLKARKVFSAGVPAELGGGGASHAELGGLLRVLWFSARAAGRTGSRGRARPSASTAAIG